MGTVVATQPQVIEDTARQDAAYLARHPYVVRLGGWTLDDYLRAAPESRRWEFARGEVLMYSPASAEHQDRVWFLAYLLFSWMQKQKWPGKLLLAPAAVQLAEDLIREPDISVFRPEDAPKVTGVPVKALPVLVVEVTSPSTRTVDLVEKAQEYASVGIPEYWVVDLPRKRFVGHALEAGRYRVSQLPRGRWVSAVLPDFWLDVAWLWQQPLPDVQKCLQEIAKQGR